MISKNDLIIKRNGTASRSGNIGNTLHQWFKATGIRFLALLLLAGMLVLGGCYSFKDLGSIPADVKTFQVELFLNKARYVNPQLSPQITDKLRQKIVGQTRLSPVQDNGDYQISGTVTGYDVSTSAISNQQASINRLTVAMSIKLVNNKNPDDPKSNFEATVSRNFDFNASLSLTQAEPQLTPDIIKNMVDEAFNRLFSNW
ncbi:LptE family protein [Paraflavitalea sp. CAU 1676]|uniref:LptE family protein n=1 Tax=Paraflavitalea sp. CAU 1676 TaxID=3032598 RepID=UPI0023DB9DF4|nr:LptE family protein [Paraflavitalea sp. CAU 1676]MDF2191985.1 LptE family protein [Paraflavitalea sp. CAU 1676]